MRGLNIVRVAVSVFCVAVILARYTWLQWPLKEEEMPTIGIGYLRDNATLDGAHIHNTILILQGTNVVIRNCRFYLHPYVGQHRYAIKFKPECRNCLISHNYISFTGSPCL